VFAAGDDSQSQICKRTRSKYAVPDKDWAELEKVFKAEDEERGVRNHA
jgi:hypothetical protein